ncbi:hypothetical protein [Moraxella bovis]|uniref:hypothetical protein n=1 Tax=Moraxella bovis TaxID=476 RepID=UPI001D1733D2|nr:hypothetical protein [Moraxella bovis]UYZ80061.1 hypothetical protein LP113_08355 [Moraxella bovis]UZA25507.1 hypothetical protein LP117_03325 [Moraxella bovis]
MSPTTSLAGTRLSEQPIQNNWATADGQDWENNQGHERRDSLPKNGWILISRIT